MIVILDGINGCGKSTVASELKRVLVGEGLGAILFHDPGSTPAGEAIRKIVRDPALPLTAVAQVLLFTAARHEMIPDVQRVVADGRWALIDRWWYSTYAYQSILGADPEFIVFLNTRVIRLPNPVRPYYLDVPVRLAAERRAAMKADKDDRFEAQELDFQEQLREWYLLLCTAGVMTKVDAGTKSAQVIAKDIFADCKGKA